MELEGTPGIKPSRRASLSSLFLPFPPWPRDNRNPGFRNPAWNVASRAGFPAPLFHRGGFVQPGSLVYIYIYIYMYLKQTKRKEHAKHWMVRILSQGFSWDRLHLEGHVEGFTKKEQVENQGKTHQIQRTTLNIKKNTQTRETQA